MSWSKDYKKSIDCSNPKGFSQRAHCAARRKRMKGEPTKSKSPFNEMHSLKTHKTVEQIAKKHRLKVSFVKNQLKMGVPIEHEHTKDKDLAIDIALQHLNEIPDYYTRLKKMESSAKKEHKKFKDVTEEGLRDWFGKSKSKDGKPGWVNVVTGGTCASDEPGEGTPKCVSSAKRASMSKAERLSASRRKKLADPGQQQKTGSAKPTYVSTDPKKKMKEEVNLSEAKDNPGKGSGKKDACYHKVKSRYKVWPSAYASGALVKCRKVGADNWGTKSESVYSLDYEWDGPIYQNGKRYCPKCQKMETSDECKYGKKFWSLYSLATEPVYQKKYTPNTPHPGNFPESYDHEYSMARSELSTIISAARRLRKKMKGEGNIEAWVQSKITKAADYLDSAADYVDSGEMKTEGASFEIGSNHRSLQRRAKIYNQIRNNPNKNEVEVAKSKLKEPKWSKPALKRESISIEDANGNHYAEFIDIIKPEPLKPSKGIGSEIIDEAGKKCWSGYKKTGTQKLFGKTYNRCVKAEEYSNWRQELGISEDWQSVNRKDKTDGLSQKAVDAYRRENPGSKLQTAVTEKKPTGKRAKRRASFCRRMKGMKSKLTSEKTARDPDSRINKALRRWNCN